MRRGSGGAGSQPRAPLRPLETHTARMVSYPVLLPDIIRG